MEKTKYLKKYPIISQNWGKVKDLRLKCLEYILAHSKLPINKYSLNEYDSKCQTRQKRNYAQTHYKMKKVKKKIKIFREELQVTRTGKETKLTLELSKSNARGKKKKCSNIFNMLKKKNFKPKTFNQTKLSL